MRMLLGIYGAGGCGRGVMPILHQNFYADDGVKFVFVDDKPSSKNINGYECISYEDFLNHDSYSKGIAIAVANSRKREFLFHQIDRDIVNIISVKSKTALIMDDVEIGSGAILSPYVTLASNVKIGTQFHCNLYSYVEHDCVIGDFVTFAPRVSCNGNVHIGSHAYIGSGAIIKNGTSLNPLVIGDGAIVGMGAVVTRDVPPGSVVVGNPARVVSC